MKKLMHTLIRLTASVFISMTLAVSVTGCDMLQQSLSSEQQEELETATGSASFAGSTWYYNGSASTGIGSVYNNSLEIDFSKKAALSTGGLTGSFVIEYTDSNGDTASVKRSLNGGAFSSDFTKYYLDLQPVAEYIDDGHFVDGKASLTVKVGGFVCSEGSQSGRTIEDLKKTISVLPLYGASTLAGVSFSTKSTTTGTAVSIPLLAAVTLADDATFSISTQSGSAFPEGVTQSDFALSLSEDKKKILLTPTVELYDQVFDAVLTIRGIVAPLAGREYTKSFPVSFSKSVSSTDSLVLTSQSSVNRDISSVATKMDGTNFVVSVNFDSVPYAWENDRVAILIDDTALENTSISFGDNEWRNAASVMSVGSTVEFYGYDTMKASDANDSNNMTTSHTWTQNSSSSYGWAYFANGTTLTYTIPLANITDGTNTASATDTFRVVVFFSDYWSTGSTHVYDVVPSAAATITTGSEKNDTVSIDFNKALVYSSEAGTYPYPAAPTNIVVKNTTASKVVLDWSDVYTAQSYIVYRTTDENQWSELATGVTSSAYIDTTVTDGTTYYYKVSAVNATGEGSASTSVSTTTPLVIMPGDFTVTKQSVSKTKVTLSWTASSNAESYAVYYKSTGDYAQFGLSTTKTKTSVTGLTTGTEYTFKVVATNVTKSKESNEVIATPTYPTMTLDGTLSESECWTDTDVASTSTDSIAADSDATTSNYDISAIYVTNDATNVYVAIQFAETPWFWKNERLTILLDNASKTTGGAATLAAVSENSGNYYHYGISSTLALASGSSVEAQITTFMSDGWAPTIANYYASGALHSEQTGIATWSATASYDSTTYKNTLNSNVVEYSIPLADVDSLAVGDVVYVYVADSHSGDSDATGSAAVADNCPAAASSATAGAWASTGASVTVDMTKALSYTIK